MDDVVILWSCSGFEIGTEAVSFVTAMLAIELRFVDVYGGVLVAEFTLLNKSSHVNERVLGSKFDLKN